jgi:hypothetical protein
LPIKDVVNDCDMNHQLYLLLREHMLNDSRSGVHCTTLTSCLRQWALQQVYDYTEMASNLYAILKGTLTHTGLSEHLYGIYSKTSNVFIETTYNRKFGDIEIIGTPDFYVENELVLDWKIPTSLPSQYRESHEKQLNVYRWLLNDWDVQTLQVCYLGAKFSRMFNLPVWPKEQTEDWIGSRLAIITDFQESGFLPPCEGKEQKGWCVRCPLLSVCTDLDSSGTICL